MRKTWDFWVADNFLLSHWNLWYVNFPQLEIPWKMTKSYFSARERCWAVRCESSFQEWKCLLEWCGRTVGMPWSVGAEKDQHERARAHATLKQAWGVKKPWVNHQWWTQWWDVWVHLDILLFDFFFRKVTRSQGNCEELNFQDFREEMNPEVCQDSEILWGRRLKLPMKYPLNSWISRPENTLNFLDAFHSD